MARVFTIDQMAMAFQAWPPKQRRKLVRTMNREMEGLSVYIKKRFFRNSGKRRQTIIINRTGALERSVKAIKVRLKGGLLTSGVQMGGMSAPHAKFLEYGTRGPYPITPKRPGGWLRFMGKEGKYVFRRMVMHPGIKAREPLGKGVRARRGPILKAMAKDHAVLLKKMFG